MNNFFNKPYIIFSVRSLIQVKTVRESVHRVTVYIYKSDRYALEYVYYIVFFISPEKLHIFIFFILQKHIHGGRSLFRPLEKYTHT